LLFSDAEIMAKNLNVSQNWIDNILNEFNDLEGINNSKETAPTVALITPSSPNPQALE
jgi:hypothetical protein